MIASPPAPRGAATVACTLLLVSCGGSGSGGESPSGLPPGAIATNPALPEGFNRFVVEASQGGQASQLLLRDVSWGRLVEVQAQAPGGERTPVFRDFAVDPGIAGDGVDYLLERSPVTGRELLVVLHALGTPGWDAAFARLEAGLRPVLPKGLDPGELPPFTAVPRNAALVLRFDDLLRDGGNPGSAGYPGTVVPENLRLLVGYPPQVLFAGRVLPDPNHGDLVGGVFHSTRAIVDATVTAVEALETGLQANALGLPEAITADEPNLLLRIPTLVDPSAAQTDVLRNLRGNAVSFTGNGPADPGSTTLDVVRALRSGGRTALTGDPFNGFLEDRVPPHLVASQPIAVDAATPTGPGRYALDLSYAQPACLMSPRPGDLLRLAGGALAEVESAGATLGAGTVTGVGARLLAGGAIAPAPGEHLTVLDPTLGHRPECFVEVGPRPPGGSLQRVDPGASFTLRFDEPMDPASLDPFEGFALVDLAAATPLGGLVVGRVVPSVDLDRFDFEPVVPLSHASGVQEAYELHLASGAAGATDLAGNPLADPLGVVGIALEGSAPALITGSRSLRFDSKDEDGDGAPELRGQAILDLQNGEVLPRPVTRFSVEVNDTSEAAPTALAMGAGAAVLDPLTPYGSRVMSVWRYHDLGLALLDDGTHNLDVEGLHWTPQASGVLFDHFPDFSIALAHARFLPDEGLDSGGSPMYPNSGLVVDYDQNALDPPEVVHAASRGYTISPIESFVSPGGRTMMPFPLNAGVAPGERAYWTWRDTANPGRGGPNGGGVDTLQLMQVTGTGTADVYPAGAVPTIGLPLLVEFRARQAGSIQGLNLLRVLVPTGGPTFRAWSSGFVSPTGVVTTVDPAQQQATGGVNTLGLSAPPIDFAVYQGQIDVVTRVSRFHTIWLDAGATSSFAAAVVDATVPAGTSIELAYRGAVAILDPAGGLGDASRYDPYGDYGGGASIFFTAGDEGWKDDPGQLDGSRFVQVRVSMTADAETGALPRLSALGLAFASD